MDRVQWAMGSGQQTVGCEQCREQWTQGLSTSFSQINIWFGNIQFLGRHLLNIALKYALCSKTSK
jgi:hypothetical protein